MLKQLNVLVEKCCTISEVAVYTATSLILRQDIFSLFLHIPLYGGRVGKATIGALSRCVSCLFLLLRIALARPDVRQTRLVDLL